MSGAHTSAGSNRRRSRLRNILHTAGYLVVALVLIGWELQEGHLYQSEDCALTTSSPSESMLMKPAYDWVLGAAHLKNSDQVAEVAIESTLKQIPDNVCVARAFTADVLKLIAAQGPRLIAIDKFYGNSSCPDNDPGTLDLLKTIRSMKVPIVVGSSTMPSKGTNTTSCLQLSPQLFTPFEDANHLGFSTAEAWISADGKRVDVPENTHHDQPVVVYTGLTRLNEDPLKIPLVWAVFDQNGTAVTEGPPGYSLPLTTAQIVNPALAKDTSLLEARQQPYANVSDPLPQQTATDLLCTKGTKPLRDRWGIQCPAQTKHVDFKDKVVVIGSQSTSDYPSVPGGQMYGFDLQAHYIAALISGAYLRDISPWWILIALVIYYGLAELLLPNMAIHEHPIFGLPHIKWPVVWEVGLFSLAMAAGFFVPLWLHRFPPLGVLVVVVAIFVPRMLIELWALLNERMDEAEKEKELSQ